MTFGDAVVRCAKDENLCATRVQIYEDVNNRHPLITKIALYDDQLVIESTKARKGCGCPVGPFCEDILVTDDLLADDWTVQPKEESD